MTVDQAVDITREALIVMLVISAPILLAGLFIGLVISLLQAVTQIQEQSLAFIPKILVMFIVAAVTLPWVGGHMLEFAREIFTLGPMP